MRAITAGKKETFEVSADETWDYLLSELLKQKLIYRKQEEKWE